MSLVRWIPILGLIALCACGGEEAGGRDDGGMVSIDDPQLGTFQIDRFKFPDVRGEKPRGNTAMADAAAACQAVGKRLCTAAEWRRACAGPDGTARYGYGADFRPGWCHIGVPLESGFTSVNEYESAVAGSGETSQCQTPEGVHDLIGNLEEWVLDDWNGQTGMLEGGAWYSQQQISDCSGLFGRQPDYRLQSDQQVFSAGFRCCTSANAPSDADVGRDAADRLAAAADADSDAAYAADDEVPLGGDVWIDRFEYPNRAGELPRVAVSWTEAEELCGAAGKRMCSAREWARACGGEDLLPYTTGDRHRPGVCPELHPGPTVSGAFAGCVSPSGARDMIGSVWEWTASPLALPERATPDTPLREVRGGSWFVDPTRARCRPRSGYPAAPQSARYEDVGFRCCRGEPAPPQPVVATETPVRVTCPASMVAVGQFCIDAYEFPNREGQVPSSGLDLDGARDACEKRGARLCTGSEWEQACAGAELRRWPYGDTYDPKACNFGDSARTAGDPQLLPAGRMDGCRTPEGVADMTGNLWEWTLDPGGNGRLRGGGWNVTSGLGQCWFAADPAEGFSLPELGARCCADGTSPVGLGVSGDPTGGQ